MFVSFVSILKVREESVAEEAQLEAGIRILSINGQPTSQMTQKEAKTLVRASNDRLELMIEGSK